MRKIIIACLVVVLITITLGAIYQRLAEINDRASIPGNLVSLDDKEVHILCIGTGGPTVILENGTWGSYPDWLDVMNGIQATTRICSYDRLGIGWSSENGVPISATEIVTTLRKVLAKQAIKSPIILAGFSAGGLYARKYVEAYPDDVFGLVLVDSAHEQQVARNAYRPNDTQIVKLCSAIAWTGFVRAFGLMDSDVPESFNPEQAIAQKKIYYRTQFCSGLLEQSEGFPLEFTGESPNSLGNIPLIVIASEKTLRDQGFGHMFSSDFLDSHAREWPRLQSELAEISSNSEFWVAHESGHSIAVEQPEIIVKAISKLIRKARSANKTSNPAP